jgi:hypothetical protein
MLLNMAKTALATVWAIISQKHLVALLPSDFDWNNRS